MTKTPATDTSPVGARATREQIDPAFAFRILEAAPTIIYVYDVKSQRRIFQNRRLAPLLAHMELDNSDGLSEWERFIHPDDAARFPAHRDRLNGIRADETLTWEFRLRHANGNWLHFATRDVLLSSDEQGLPWLVVGSIADVTEQRQAVERRDLLLQEMGHRARNFANVIEAIGKQALPSENPEAVQFFRTLMARLRALLDAGQIVLASDARTAELRKVIEKTLAPFADPASPVFMLEGPHIDVPEAIAGAIALALHELATNAVKYGALSQPDGHIALVWSVEESTSKKTLALEWNERSGLKIVTPTRQGFGTRLIHFAAPREADGSVDLEFQSDGVCCRIKLVLREDR